MMLLLDPTTSLARGLARKKVEVVNYPDGRFAVQFNGTALGFKVFDKIQTVQPGAIVDNKRLSAVLEQLKAQRPPIRRISSEGTLRDIDRRTTSRRRAWPAVEGTGATPRCCRGCGLRQRTGWRADRHRCSLVFRYVTETPPAKPASSRRG
jgi:hypothetical protein